MPSVVFVALRYYALIIIARHIVQSSFSKLIEAKK